MMYFILMRRRCKTCKGCDAKFEADEVRVFKVREGNAKQGRKCLKIICFQISNDERSESGWMRSDNSSLRMWFDGLFSV